METYDCGKELRNEIYVEFPYEWQDGMNRVFTIKKLKKLALIT